jgi:hypothetical protein
LPQNTDCIDWQVTLAWEEALETLNVKRPRTMKGIEKVADVEKVLELVLPWRVTNSDVLKLQREEVILRCKKESEAQLIKILEHLRF